MAGILEALSDNISIDKDKCTYCGKCVDTCILDNLRLNLAPCRAACPMGVNVQGYVQLILRGEDDKARALVREALPFPTIMCMICHHPCETACQRGKDDAPVAVRALKRYLFDSPGAVRAVRPVPAPATGKRMTVIGGGPAGLVAAHDLALRGHAVTLLDAGGRPGGQLVQSIPPFRLAQSTVEEELDVLRVLGVEMTQGCAVGRDRHLADILAESDAVILSTGLGGGRKLGLPGEELNGVEDAISFLRGVKSGLDPRLSGHVAVVGGGNVAVDAALCALRQGAQQVTMITLEEEGKLPAFPHELEQIRAEGGHFLHGQGVSFLRGENGRLTGLGLRGCLRVFDEAGRFAPVYDATCQRDLDVDHCIVAVGLEADASPLAGTGLTLADVRNADPLTRQTREPKLFVAGDVSGRAGSVVDAMADGRRAAESAHRLVSGEHLAFGRAYAGPVETDFAIDTSRGGPAPRQTPDPADRTPYDVPDRPYTPAQARTEASRCYSCGAPYGKYRTCWFCLPCEVECPENALYVQIPYLSR